MTDFFIQKDIFLRPLEPEDLDILYRWENDTRLWSVGATVSPFSRFILKKYLVDTADDIYQTKQLRMMIVKKSNNQPVGTLDLYEFDALNARAGVGVLIDEKYRNKGYAAQSVDAIEKYAFNHLNLHQLYAYVPETNRASFALFSKSNFTQTAVLKEWLLINRKYVDVLVMQKINPQTLELK